MRNHELEGPPFLFAVLPRRIDERTQARPGLTRALLDWILRSTMRADDESRLSRHAGGRV